MRRQLYLILLALALQAGTSAAGDPPAVGVIMAQEKPLTETNQFIGRVQSEKTVKLVARVTGFLEKRDFEEGAEVKKGQLLFVIEQPPYQADVQQRQGALEQLQAKLANAKIELGRAKALLPTPAGRQSTYDTALASERSYAAQVVSAEAQLKTAQINLSYTEIHAPIDGKIGQTLVNVGNVVGPTTGTLDTIVSQDPMYVTFPVSVRETVALGDRYVPKGGFKAVIIKIRLPDGRIYDQTGHVDFVSPTVATETETVLWRATIPNPPLPYAHAINRPIRELIDNEFVTVLLEGVQPVMAIAIPRAAIMSDQQGNYVYVVNAQNKAEVHYIETIQSTPETVFIKSGVKEGERVILEGLQRVHPGEEVASSPAQALPNATAPSP